MGSYAQSRSYEKVTGKKISASVIQSSMFCNSNTEIVCLQVEALHYLLPGGKAHAV